MRHRDDLKNEAVYDQDKQDRQAWELSRKGGVSRRQALHMMGAGLGAAAFLGWGERSLAGPIIKDLPVDQFIPRGTTNAEMLWTGLNFSDYLVPNAQFFVRTHVAAPTIDPETWRLEITGDGVSQPLSLSLEDLMCLRSRTVVKFIECAGNGRSFFNNHSQPLDPPRVSGQPNVSGSAWELGAIGVAAWRGVRLSDVLCRAGLKEEAVDLMPEGLDAPFQTFGSVRRPVPIEKALDDVLLVYEMNGQPLPPDHGAPVRILVPGWVGIANIKWVGKINVSTTFQRSPFNTNFYSNPPGSMSDTGEPVNALTTQGVKSAFHFRLFNSTVSTPPLPIVGTAVPLAAGPQLLSGRAWSGESSIRKVEVSFDGGASYHRTLLVPPNLPEAWVRWVTYWNPEPGSYTLVTRATDNQGNSNEIAATNPNPNNLQGYRFDGLPLVPVVVT